MTHVGLDQARIIGALTSPDRKAPFERAPLVTDGPEGLIIRNGRDEPLTYSEWEALLAQREAMRLGQALMFEPGLWLWVFRSNFVLGRTGICNALSRVGRLAWIEEDSEHWLCCYVRDRGLTAFRAEWANKAMQLAEEAIARQDPEYAVAAAQTAYHLEPRRTPRATELIAQAYRLAENTVRAEGYERIAPTRQPEDK